MVSNDVPSGVQVTTDTERRTISIATAAYPVTYVSLGGTIMRQVEGDLPKVMERELSHEDAITLRRHLDEAIQELEGGTDPT